MDTGCNTHDLLECECDSDSQIPDDFVMESEKDLVVEAEQGFVVASELRQEKLDAVDKAVRLCRYGSMKDFIKYAIFSICRRKKQV